MPALRPAPASSQRLARPHRPATTEIRRYGLHERLVACFGTGGDALYVFGSTALAIAISGLAAYISRQPLLFPSLGPTALLFFGSPLAGSASPRNAIVGHAVALAVGYGSLALFGLLGAPGALQSGMTTGRVGAAALAVALTGALLVLARATHPPAAATTLLVSLGLLATPRDLLAVAAGVALLTASGWALNRLLGLPVPLWAAAHRRDSAGG